MQVLHDTGLLIGLKTKMNLRLILPLVKDKEENQI